MVVVFPDPLGPTNPAITPRALEKAAKAYEKAGKNDEANRVVKELHQRYPDYAGG